MSGPLHGARWAPTLGGQGLPHPLHLPVGWPRSPNAPISQDREDREELGQDLLSRRHTLDLHVLTNHTAHFHMLTVTTSRVHPVRQLDDIPRPEGCKLPRATGCTMVGETQLVILSPLLPHKDSPNFLRWRWRWCWHCSGKDA